MNPLVAVGVSLTLLFGLTTPVEASDANSDIPIAWVAYATQLSKSMQGWLAESNQSAERLHEYLNGLYIESGKKITTIPVSVWIEKNGRVLRITFVPFIHPQANDDMHHIFEGRQVAIPPANMPMPLRVQLRVNVVTST